MKRLIVSKLFLYDKRLSHAKNPSTYSICRDPSGIWINDEFVVRRNDRVSDLAIWTFWAVSIRGKYPEKSCACKK